VDVPGTVVLVRVDQLLTEDEATVAEVLQLRVVGISVLVITVVLARLLCVV
jgi:hypothetical protein